MWPSDSPVVSSVQGAVKGMLTVTKHSVRARHCAKCFLCPDSIYSSHCAGSRLEDPHFAGEEEELPGWEGGFPESHGVGVSEDLNPGLWMADAEL